MMTVEMCRERSSRSLQLLNGLKIRLVSDSTLRVGSANLIVNAGMCDESDEVPGLAHFCEHLLFMGNEKYPEEYGLNTFVAQGNGYCNAVTSNTRTNYYFEVAPGQFEEGLDRFAHMFLSPLFTESAIEKEVNAVDCEFRDIQYNDTRMECYLNGTLSPPGHYTRKICGGNRQTLIERPASKGINVRDEVANFFKKNYSANVMTLTIYGKQSLEELEEMVQKLPFHEIRNNNIPPRVYEEPPPYAPENRGCRFDIVPVKLIRRLTIWFDSRAYDCICELLAHRTKGSLAYELKRRGWASFVRSSESSWLTNRLRVTIDLSKEGLTHVEDILELLFLYIGMLVRKGPQKWFHEELRAMDEIRNRFDPEQENARKPRQEAIDHTFYEDWIKKVLGQLTPKNMVYFVSAKENATLEGLGREEYYRIQYRKTEPCEELLERLEKALKTESDAFFLPPRNKYIPTKFEQKPRDGAERQAGLMQKNQKQSSCYSKYPRVIEDIQLQRIWYLRGHSNAHPWVEVRALFSLPISRVNALSFFMARLFVECFSHHARSEFFNAQQAGFEFELTGEPRGLHLQISGYDEMMGYFVSSYFSALISYKPDRITFDHMLEELIRIYKNVPYSEPHVYARYILHYILSEGRWSVNQLLQASQAVTFEAFLEFIQNMWSTWHLEIFFYGNLTEEEALTWGRAGLQDTAPVRALLSQEPMPLSAAQLPEGKPHFFEVDQVVHANSAVVVFLETGAHEPRTTIITKLLFRLIEKPAFNALRTKDQLGYIVQFTQKTYNDTHGLLIAVQGNYDPTYVEQCIERFLENFKEKIEAMSEKEFQEWKQNKWHDYSDQMANASWQYWQEIQSGRYCFDKFEIEANELYSLSKADLLDLYTRKILAGSKKRQKISIRVCSTTACKEPRTAGEQEGTAIEELERFKAALPLRRHKDQKVIHLSTNSPTLKKILATV
uniref:Peptidase_M16 domain-containing protein n=1 Tax=Steinernema glaseri TaxID=37863 RepID=A0A1I7Z243_9BILA